MERSAHRRGSLTVGWASGSELADAVWKVVERFVPEEERRSVARRLIRTFERRDCDTMHESKLWRVAGKRDPW